MSKAILSTSNIQSILSNRYPMLLVDRVCVESEERVIGIKNLTFNEEFFQGHFPGHPIMPGVLQIEAMKQVAEIATYAKINPSQDKNVYIKNLTKVKFRKPVNPGDRIQIEIDVLEVNESSATVKAIIKNIAGVTCQATITLATRERIESDAMPELWTDLDKTDDILLDAIQIQEIIPHRYPFMFIDYIKTMGVKDVIAVKNLSYNEPFFRGNSPEYAVLSESILSEIVAQTGCVVMLSQDEHKGKIGYFMGIDKAEFFAPALPGDQLIIDVTLGKANSRFGKAVGVIKVADKLIAEINLSFALVEA